VKGKGSARLSLYRHLAPLTVDAITWGLPMDSRVNVQQAMVCVFTSIKVGVEKPRLSFEKGDVAFLASGSLLCFFSKNAKSAVPLNPVGKVDSGVEVLDSLSIKVIGIEDLIVDRLNACVHWKYETDCEWASYLIKKFENEIDWDYLKQEAGKEQVDAKLTELARRE
jgi:hypothetical protein